jgi:Na+-driven multidrug efflux pump
MILLIVPLIYLGSNLFGIKGIFFGLAIANIIAGTIAYLVIRQQIKDPITGR